MPKHTIKIILAKNSNIEKAFFWYMGNHILPSNILLYGFLPKASFVQLFLRSLLAKKKNDELIKITLNGKRVGYLNYSINKQKLLIDWVFIDKSMQNKKIGFKAVKYIESSAKKKGLHYIETWIDTGNIQSSNFFKKLNYRSQGTKVLYYYHSCSDRLSMRLFWSFLKSEILLITSGSLKKPKKNIMQYTLTKGVIFRMGEIPDNSDDFLDQLCFDLGAKAIVFQTKMAVISNRSILIGKKVKWIKIL